jgi:hypothetical protein
MKKRSFIYEEIVGFLVSQNLINMSFSANQILIKRSKKTSVSFVYKHSNKKHKDTWTLFFIRVSDCRPMQFRIDFTILDTYENKFKVQLIKKK